VIVLSEGELDAEGDDCYSRNGAALRRSPIRRIAESLLPGLWPCSPALRYQLGVAIELGVERFAASWAPRNQPAGALAVNVADVVRAAVTVGGPVRGTAWHRSLRRAGIAGSVLAALAGAGRTHPLATTTLYRQLETTEKSGVSFRLGMAFAALAAEHVLSVRLLEHLNRSNAVLAQGSQRRADLFGMDGSGRWHVVEAKSRTYGFEQMDVDAAKQQALNVHAVRPNGNPLVPATRSASLADLARTPIAMLLIDPVGEPAAEATYQVDVEAFVATHFSPVPDLLEVQGAPQPPPADVADTDAVGAYLPGTDIWLGLDASLLGESPRPWEQRLQERTPRGDRPTAQDERVSIGEDGHVLSLGADLARTYMWPGQEEAEREGGQS
jgi:hypothetical protein